MKSRLAVWCVSTALGSFCACSGEEFVPSMPPPDAGQDVAVEDLQPEPDLPASWDVTRSDSQDLGAVDTDAAEDVATWPADPLADQNQWGPAGRVVRLEVPATPEDARHAGCFVVGSKVGTGLYSLLVLAGGLGQYLAPNAEGKVEVALFTRAIGWAPGVTAEALDTIDLEVLSGDPDPSEGWMIARASFVDDVPGGPVRLRYPASLVHQGWLESTAGDFELVLRVLGLAAQLKFSLVQFSGRLYAEGPGFGMRDGVMTGYLSKEDGVGLVQGILDDCMREDAPDLCGSVLNLLGVPESEEELLEVVESFIGGFDAHLGPTGPMACAPETEAPCDALSVCLVLDLEGVQLEGIAP